MTNATKLRYYVSMEIQEKITTIIKKHGLRLTATRQAVLELFFRQHTPLSATKILGVLDEAALRVNKTTVYRELEKLVTLGILKSVSLKDRTQYYELASRHHHHHLICLECKRILDIDIPDETLVMRAEQLGKKVHFSVLSHSLEFYGHCTQCFTAPLS